jgi:hypothetical protein
MSKVRRKREGQACRKADFPKFLDGAFAQALMPMGGWVLASGARFQLAQRCKLEATHSPTKMPRLLRIEA